MSGDGLALHRHPLCEFPGGDKTPEEREKDQSRALAKLALALQAIRLLLELLKTGDR